MAADPNETAWFEAVGIEIECMIVDRGDGRVRPLCDRLLAAHNGGHFDDAVFEDITWSNELALHVVELKTTWPARSVAATAEAFQAHVNKINRWLATQDACLMGGGMHPWMDPSREFRLWPHSNGEVYSAFDRIFDCRGHGWANLQSVHINLPFKGDEQFARLHAAVRLILPILPALAAASPIADGKPTGRLDHRLEVYRTNCSRVPSCTGQVIPEIVGSIGEYHARILDPIYRDMAELDPQGVLRHEWCNARGAIARFDRNTLEIRVIDSQECVRMNLAIAALTLAVVRMLTLEVWSPMSRQNIATQPLKQLLDRCVTDGENALIEDRDYLACFGWTNKPCTARSLWSHLLQNVSRNSSDEIASFEIDLAGLLQHGSLATRILKRTQTCNLNDIAHEMAVVYENNSPFWTI